VTWGARQRLGIEASPAPRQNGKAASVTVMPPAAVNLLLPSSNAVSKKPAWLCVYGQGALRLWATANFGRRNNRDLKSAPWPVNAKARKRKGTSSWTLHLKKVYV
jgi:hypothetical protein